MKTSDPRRAGADAANADTPHADASRAHVPRADALSVDPARPYDDLDAIGEAGRAILAAAIRHLDVPADARVTTRERPETLERLFDPPPASGRPLNELLERLSGNIADESIRLAHPMYMGHQVCPPLPVAALADSLVSMLNQSQAVWEMSPATSVLESKLIRWFAGLAGFGEGAGGSFVSGGSAGNLTALLAARASRFPDAWTRGNPAGLAIVTGEQSHYSVERAAGVMGLGTDAVVSVGTTQAGQTDPEAVAAALDRLAAAGRPVLAVCATSGSTPTGAFDDLPALAEICRRHGVWLHVDGAHGASALLSRTHRHRLDGLELADSLAWDAHKMMFQPLSSAVVLVRERRHLERAFQQNAPYLFHPGQDSGQDEAAPIDSGTWTLQCSRRADALRLWLALEYYGTDLLGALFDHTVALAGELHERLATAPDFQALHEPHANIVCFKYLPENTRNGMADNHALDRFQDEIRERYNTSGQGWITATTLNGRRVLRVTLINPRTKSEHLDQLLEGIRQVDEGR